MQSTLRDPRPASKAPGPLPLIILIVTLTGCRNLNPKPFTQYRDAVQGVQTSTDSLLSANYSWTRADFVERFANNPGSQISSLLIQLQDDGSLKVGAQPLYLEIKEMRAVLVELNQAFFEYTDLLVKLSTPGLVKAAEFDQMAEDLNKRVSSALKAANVIGAEKAGLLSAAAAKAWHAHLEHLRRSALKEALEANQETVRLYSESCAQLVRATGSGLSTLYTAQSGQITDAWKKTTDVKKRLEATQQLLALNEQFIDLHRVLKELLLAYQTLPDAHRFLSETLRESTPPTNGLRSFLQCSERLHRLDASLTKVEAKSKKSD